MTSRKLSWWRCFRAHWAYCPCACAGPWQHPRRSGRERNPHSDWLGICKFLHGIYPGLLIIPYNTGYPFYNRSPIHLAIKNKHLHLCQWLHSVGAANNIDHELLVEETLPDHKELCLWAILVGALSSDGEGGHIDSKKASEVFEDYPEEQKQISDEMTAMLANDADKKLEQLLLGEWQEIPDAGSLVDAAMTRAGEFVRLC